MDGQEQPRNVQFWKVPAATSDMELVGSNKGRSNTSVAKVAR